MALKKIKGGKSEPAKTAALMRTVQVQGTIIQQFVEAKTALAAAEAQIQALEPIIKRTGAHAVLQDNVLLNGPEVKSVKLVDDSGKGVRVTLASVYPALSEESAETLFEKTLKKIDGSTGDVNDYVIQVRKAKFDSGAFLKDGLFNEKAYNAFSKACAEVAKAFGVANPLTTDVVTVVKPEFDKIRYEDFDLAAQVRIYEVIPHKTSITPIVTGE